MIDDHLGVRSRFNRVLKRLVRPAIYGDRIPLEVFAHHVHGEPIPASDARSREYVPFSVGQAWGGAWDTTWFRMRARIPEPWRGSEVAALLDLGGAGMVGFTAEGLVWEGDQPRQGLHLKHRDYVVARPAVGGEAVELMIEAAANPIPPWGETQWPLLMPDVDGPAIYRLGQADLAIVRRDVDALSFDMLVLAQLLETLPDDSTRAHRRLPAPSSRRATSSSATASWPRCRLRVPRSRRRSRARPGPMRTARPRSGMRTSTRRGYGRSARRSASARGRFPTR